MKLEKLICAIPHEGGADMEIEGIEYNSKLARAGDIFVCLPGAKRDGHDFAPMAYENGVRAFLCEKAVDLPNDAVQIITPDTRSALAVIAAEFYGHPAKKLRLIGITGTKGKTTTALLVSAILNAAGKNCAYIGSNGVIINGKQTETVNTTPESLQLQAYFAQMVNENVEYAVLEVSSQALMHNRVDGLDFEVTAFTNFSPDHIGEGEHADLDEYKNAKKRLFDRFSARCAVYNADDPHSAYMLSGHSGNTVSFAVNGKADITANKPDLYRDTTSLGISFECAFEGTTIPVKLMTPGTFSVYNGLCAMAICNQFDVSLHFASSVLSRTPVQGRFEVVEGKAGVTFIVDYSHNGLSLTKALQTLKEYEHRRIICVFGSVGGRTQCRRKELADAASLFADLCIVTSDNPDFEDPDAIVSEIASHLTDVEYECITDRTEAIKRAVSIAEAGDIVLFAGKGHETYQLICGQKVPFCERDIIKDACKVLFGATV